MKFIRFAEWRINQTGEGVLGYITNHGYLDNPTFRGMRQHLMETFDEIYVLDLHGNSKKKEKAPDGGKDENVFDIQQGVAIMLAVKVKSRAGEAKKAPARVFHADLWGRREIYDGEQLTGGKYHWLWQNSAETTPWQELQPSSPFHLFKPQDTELRTEYEGGWKATEIMPVNTVGVVTSKDASTIAFTPPEATALATIHKLSPTVVRSFLYRPFDFRYIVYDKKVVARSRYNVMRHMIPGQNIARHMLGGENVALLISRQALTDFRHAFVSDKITNKNNIDIAGRFGSGYHFPLYLYPLPDELDAEAGRRPNISPAFLKALAEKLKAPQEAPHGLPAGVTPEDIFHYAYAVFHSPTYRKRYAEFLKIDFPRLPLTSNRDMFFSLAALGGELVGLHLMESPKLNDLITEFPEKGSDAVEKVTFAVDADLRAASDSGRVWINPTQYFGGVPAAVWSFHIGGYQVCEKWLKDRKGRTMTYEDIQCYQKIVVALNETIRLMAEIDKVIETQGGWPTAFSGNKT